MKQITPLFLVAMSILAGCQTNQSQENNRTLGPGASPSPATAKLELDLDSLTVEDMNKLGLLIASGNSKSIETLVSIREYLYSPESGYTRERSQVDRNITLINAALLPVGEAASKSKEGMDILKKVASKKPLRAFVSEPLGVAAHNGNEEAIDILVNHKMYDIINGKAVRALAPVAETNHPKVVSFLVMASQSPDYKFYRKDIIAGLASAAYLGNTDAIEALKLMKENQSQ